MGHSSVKVTEGYLEYLTPEEAERTKNGTPATVAERSEPIFAMYNKAFSRLAKE